LAGGAIAQVDADANAYSHRDEKLMCYSVAMLPSIEMVVPVRQQFRRLREALGQARTGKVYMNFIEGEELRERTRDGHSEKAFQRLQAIKARYDPDNRMISGFDIPPAKA
jgi:FAD/FMN-containing dehydrogenase